MFLYSKQTQYTYRILLIIRCIISVHVGYRYVSFSSETEQGKGGTFVEGTTEKVNYLPYVTTNDADNFYQSFLYNGCVYPSFSGTNITYREELCSVTTQDYKTYIITAHDGHTRSDGEPVTLNDIYFTYNTILKDNYRNIAALDSFSNISVIADEENASIAVVFPKASTDNMIFFTNFILPSHALANKSLEEYVSTSFSDPVGSACGRLTDTNYDADSIVFDLTNCDQASLKFYQIKQFADQAAMDTYVESSNNTIDLIVDNQYSYANYTANPVILNTFSTIFFNTQSTLLPTTLRSYLATQIADQAKKTTSLDNVITYDPFLFDAVSSSYSGTLEALIQGATTPVDTSTPTTYPLLPQIVRWTPRADTQEYLVKTVIEDKQSIKMVFEESFDRVSISFNDGVEYFPESYDASTKSTYYNLNPTYRNIVEGRNTYTVKAYTNDVHTATYELIVHYLSAPTPAAQEEGTNIGDQYQPLAIIYFNDKTNNAVASFLRDYFTARGVDSYITFQGFDDPDIFAGKIQSKDYDIAISSISMGLRKDMSNLFLTDNPTINPSLYTNEDLALAINKRFLFPQATRSEPKQTIDRIYSQDVPFVILGKQLGTIHIKDTLSFPYPLRMYVLGRRKDSLKDLPIFQHFRINRDRIRSKHNFRTFLSTGGTTK